jgi:hypothetical protein
MSTLRGSMSQPIAILELMSTTSIEFSNFALEISQACRGLGIKVPMYRTAPPGTSTRRRIRRFEDGSSLITIATHGRHNAEVLADMVEGAIAANPTDARASELRSTVTINFQPDDLRAA